MPSSAEDLRITTGKFQAILCCILKRKCCVKRRGVILLPKGGGTAEKHLFGVTVTCAMFFGVPVTYCRSSFKEYRTGRFGVVTACAIIFMTTFLLTCGDIESNPGPTEGEQNTSPTVNTVSTNNDPHSHSQQLSDFRQDIINTLNTAMQTMSTTSSSTINSAIDRAVKRLEASQTEHAETVQQDLRAMSDAINQRLHGVEEGQSELFDEIQGLRSYCEDLKSENEHLKEQVAFLTGKCDSLENHSKRNNLIFWGLERQAGETWDDCEDMVREVIRDGMGVREEIMVERAHRVGERIVVKLLSYKQKMLVLRNSWRLKSARGFENVFVREDLSWEVRKKRQILSNRARELRDRGQKTKLRFDKLFTEDGIFTCNTESETIVQLPTRKQTRQDKPREQQEKPREQRVTQKPPEATSRERSLDRRFVNDWDFDFVNEPLSQQEENFILQTSEYPALNVSNGRESQSVSTRQSGSHTQQPAVSSGLEAGNPHVQHGGDSRRHSYIPVRQSPVNTRARGKAKSTSDTQQHDQNTLHQWLGNTNSDKDQTEVKGRGRGRGGGRVGMRGASTVGKRGGRGNQSGATKSANTQ